MGKRKRTGSTSAHTPTDSTPCSSGRDRTLGDVHTRTAVCCSHEENTSDSDNSKIFEHHSSVKETMDSPGKHSNSQFSLGQHHHNLSRSMFLKCSRHHYGNQYSRRNSVNHHKPSTSYGKGNTFHDDRLCFKLGSRSNFGLAHHPEFRERAFWQPERIRTSSLVIDTVSPDGMKMMCGICQKSLRRKPHNFGTTLASEELSIVAVLVCGHIYHADCLEQKTSLEDRTDPPCPVCSELSTTSSVHQTF